MHKFSQDVDCSKQTYLSFNTGALLQRFSKLLSLWSTQLVVGSSWWTKKLLVKADAGDLSVKKDDCLDSQLTCTFSSASDLWLVPLLWGVYFGKRIWLEQESGTFMGRGERIGHVPELGTDCLGLSLSILEMQENTSFFRSRQLLSKLVVVEQALDPIGPEFHNCDSLMLSVGCSVSWSMLSTAQFGSETSASMYSEAILCHKLFAEFSTEGETNKVINWCNSNETTTCSIFAIAVELILKIKQKFCSIWA